VAPAAVTQLLVRAVHGAHAAVGAEEDTEEFHFFCFGEPIVFLGSFVIY
jgi:hypothetical protein